MKLRRVLLVLLTLAIVLLPALGAIAATAVSMEEVLIGFKGAADPALIRAHGGEVTHEFIYMPVVAAELPAAAVEALQNNPTIAYVEPNHKAYAIGQVLPWGVDRIDADVVQAGGQLATGVKVAILDTGIDGSHSDLTVLGGYNYIDNTTNWQDDHGHGTHVAGTVAALDNTIDVIGVGPEAALYAVKVLDSGGSGSYDGIAAGIEWAITNGMQVINMSLGGSSDSETLRTACQNAYNAGIVIVAAAGNSGNPAGKGDNIGYPAKYETVIAVGATDSNDKRASFSSTGPDLEITAPGVSIVSTALGGGTTSMSGTSMASPHVAGVAALVLAANPGISNVDVRATMNNTAEPIGNGDPNLYGNGLVDAEAAVTGSSGGGGGDGGGDSGALSVSIATNKTTYTLGETISITTTVTDDLGAAVEGATVDCTITTASGKVYASSATTDSAGQAFFSLKTKRPDGVGTYTIDAAASKTGYTSGSASITVDVQ